ncbi:lysophosphatidic acid phosphatase type 6-like [Babylonia areolata]|uniref:lysophosphatidic acid phosphatase type 6-like n=1 Tax=Babylonia areolata TaxID=304850 RepID=UPI003FD15E74
MNWNKALKITGFVGATVCGGCLANAYIKSNSTVDSERAMTENETPPTKAMTLKQVHVYFRHGARTPIHVIPGLEEVTYSKDFVLRTPSHFKFKHRVLVLPDLKPRGVSDFETHYKKTPLKGGGYAGNLTTFGQEQMYCLGLSLRRAYVDVHQFLTEGYQPEDVYVQSTNIDRTIASARCVMAGLFGKEDLDRNGPVTIPVWLTPDEVLFPNSHVCEVVREANHAAMIHFDNIPGIKEDREVIEKVIGYESETPLNFIFLRDDLIARVTHGYAIPKHIQPYMEMIENNATKLLYFAMCGQHDAERPIVTRLAAGPALNLMLEGMEKMKRGDKTQKICLYSTHDSTTIALLEGLGIFDWKWPPFAADVRVELYEDEEGEHWVRCLYLGQEKTVRGCSGPMCRYSEFQESLKPYVIARGAEFDEVCSSGILEQIAASLLQHDQDEVETPEIKEASEIPAGM